MRKRNNMIITNLKCEECDNVFNIPRKNGDKRGKGHVKHVWCFICKETTAHRDFINDYDVFGRFSLDREDIEMLKINQIEKINTHQTVYASGKL